MPVEGNIAWVMIATALVLFMTPGLAFFYGGMVRSKNFLAMLMQNYFAIGLLAVLWVLVGASIAFGNLGDGGLLGNFDFLGFKDIGATDVMFGAFTGSNIPDSLFLTFQMTFAIITPALIVGAFAERMKFSAMLWFMGIWSVVVYAPVAHMVWGGEGALMGDLGVLDFAGGTVVHINAGIAALVAALVLGRRRGYPTTAMPPHNLTLTVVGAGMLWVGWFGFNAGSAVAADGSAGMAMAVTQLATATAALAWMFAEWVAHGKPSVLGIASGAVAGLVAITPASGTAGPMGAMAIGAVAGVVCFLSATRMKRALGYDDALDAFGVHAVGGIVGAVLTGVFADAAFGGKGLAEGMTLAGQVWVQVLGVLLTAAYTAVASYVILKGIDLAMGLRVDEESETLGLDLSQHDERGYVL